MSRGSNVPLAAFTAKYSSVSEKRVEVKIVGQLLAKAFRSCNLRHNGFLTQVDIREILIKLKNNKELPMSEVEEIMSKYTVDEVDGKRFCRCMVWPEW